MIISLQGVLVAVSPLRVVIELNGVGYEVHVPLTTAERLPAPGSAARLFTHVVYRENAQLLYGFGTEEERDFFRLMIENVTGVGPKLALTIMSRLDLARLRTAIQVGDVNALSDCPGIGRRTAERLVVELKSRLDASGGTAAAGALAGGKDGAKAGAVAALIALGYKSAEAERAVQKAAAGLGESAATEALVKKALG